MPAARCCSRFWITPRQKPRFWPWGIPTWPRISPPYRIIFALFPTPAFRKSARSKLFLAKSPFTATCRSAIPNIAQRGAGIERPAQAAQEGSQHAHTQLRQLIRLLMFLALLSAPAGAARLQCQCEERQRRPGKEGGHRDPGWRTARQQGSRRPRYRPSGLSRRAPERKAIMTTTEKQRQRQYLQQPVRAESGGRRIPVRRFARKTHRVLHRPTEEIWQRAGVPYQQEARRAPS